MRGPQPCGTISAAVASAGRIHILDEFNSMLGAHKYGGKSGFPMDQYTTHCRQLAANGSSNIEALGVVLDRDIVADPDREGHALLRVELSIRTRLAENDGAVAWKDFTQEERIFIREHKTRLKLKRLPDQTIMNSKLHGLRQKSDMISFLQQSPGGVCCFELFEEYPDAHQDVLDLLHSGRAVSYGTEIWDGETSFKQVMSN